MHALEKQNSNENRSQHSSEIVLAILNSPSKFWVQSKLDAEYSDADFVLMIHDLSASSQPFHNFRLRITQLESASAIVRLRVNSFQFQS